jgi:hypothetical protein
MLPINLLRHYNKQGQRCSLRTGTAKRPDTEFGSLICSELLLTRFFNKALTRQNRDVIVSCARSRPQCKVKHPSCVQGGIQMALGSFLRSAPRLPPLCRPIFNQDVETCNALVQCRKFVLSARKRRAGGTRRTADTNNYQQHTHWRWHAPRDFLVVEITVDCNDRLPRLPFGVAGESDTDAFT